MNSNGKDKDINTKENLDHPLRQLIGAGTAIYNEFDLAKEREVMWPR